MLTLRPPACPQTLDALTELPQLTLRRVEVVSDTSGADLRALLDCERCQLSSLLVSSSPSEAESAQMAGALACHASCERVELEADSFGAHAGARSMLAALRTAFAVKCNDQPRGSLREITLLATNTVPQLLELVQVLDAARSGPGASVAPPPEDLELHCMYAHCSGGVSPAFLELLRSRRLRVSSLSFDSLRDEEEPELVQQLGAALLAAGSQVPALLPFGGQLSIVSLSNCHLRSDELAMLLPAISRCAPGLQCLELKGNQVGPSAAKALAELLSCCTQLNELDLDGTQLGDAGTEVLARELMDCAAGGYNTLLRLRLSNCRIGDRGAQALAVALAHEPALALQELDLGENEIGALGGTALATALSAGTPLRDLRVKDNCTGEGPAGCVPLLVALLASDTAAEAAAAELGDAAFENTVVQDSMRTQGAIPLLLNMLEQGVGIGRREEAAWALWALACEMAITRTALVDAGALPVLAAALQRTEEVPCPEVTEKVCAVLWCLAATDEMRLRIVATGVTRTLLRLLRLAHGMAAAEEGAGHRHLMARVPLMLVGTLTALAQSPSLRPQLRQDRLLEPAAALALADEGVVELPAQYQALLAVLLLCAPPGRGEECPHSDAELDAASQQLLHRVLAHSSIGRDAGQHLAATLAATLVARGTSHPGVAEDDGLYLDCTWSVEEVCIHLCAATGAAPLLASSLATEHDVGAMLTHVLRNSLGGEGAAVPACDALCAMAQAGAAAREALRACGALRALRVTARGAGSPQLAAAARATLAAMGEGGSHAGAARPAGTAGGGGGGGGARAGRRRRTSEEEEGPPAQCKRARTLHEEDAQEGKRRRITL